METLEIAPDGKSLCPRSRFAKLVNLPELQQMFRSYADVQTAAMLDLPRPRLQGDKATVIACPMSEAQHALQDALVQRYEAIRAGKVKPWDDNALAITTDGRKLALDARLLSPVATDVPESKLNALVSNVAALWQRTTPTRGTQLIFADLGVHPTPWGYAVYDDIVTKLAQHGVPREQIACTGEADTDGKKQSLFTRVRQPCAIKPSGPGKKREEAGPVHQGAAGHRAHPARQHPEDGCRHQRATAAGGEP